MLNFAKKINLASVCEEITDSLSFHYFEITEHF